MEYMESKLVVDSKWRYFLWQWAAIFGGILSLGLAIPFFSNKYNKFIVEHTYIDGHKMKYTGSAKDLFKHYIVWYLIVAASYIGLVIIAYYLKPLVKFNIVRYVALINAFIISYLINYNLKLYRITHTHFDEIENGETRVIFKWEQIKSWVVKSVLSKVLKYLTIFVAWPISYSLEENYDYERSIIDGNTFDYKARFKGYIKTWLPNILLLIFTLFIAYPIVALNIRIWSAKNVHIKGEFLKK